MHYNLIGQNELTTRILSAIFLASTSLFFLSQDGRLSLYFIYTLIIGLTVEWLILFYRNWPKQFWKSCLSILTFCLGLSTLLIVFLVFPEFKGSDWLFLLGIIWGTDTGAYAFGRLIGGPRLAPRISPGKTWSGFVGGSLCGTSVGWILFQYFHFQIPLGLQDHIHCLPATLCFFISLVAQLGDLMESGVKRLLSVKNSSSIIPGHGGLWDRLDSLLGVIVIFNVLSFIIARVMY